MKSARGCITGLIIILILAAGCLMAVGSLAQCDDETPTPVPTNTPSDAPLEPTVDVLPSPTATVSTIMLPTPTPTEIIVITTPPVPPTVESHLLSDSRAVEDQSQPVSGATRAPSVSHLAVLLPETGMDISTVLLIAAGVVALVLFVLFLKVVFEKPVDTGGRPVPIDEDWE